MRYKVLGKTGLKVSELSLGTMTFGEEWGWGSNAIESQAIFDKYVEAGGNFIDTANKYTEGSSERLLGHMIKPMRENVVLATKYTLSMDMANPNSSGNNRKNLVQSVEASLKRLDTDYIDLLWVHAWDYFTNESQLMLQLEQICASGKVLHIAISDTPAWIISKLNTIAELRGTTPFSAIQVLYNLIERTPERELIPMANSLSMTVMPWSPLAGGFLSGKYLQNDGQARRMGEKHPLSDNPRNMLILNKLVELANSLEINPAQLALAWSFRGNGINSNVPIIGARNLEQLNQNLSVLELEVPNHIFDSLDEISKPELGFPHDFLLRPRTRELVYGNFDGKVDA